MCFMQGQGHQLHHLRAEGLGGLLGDGGRERLPPTTPPASDSMVTSQLRA